MNTLSTSFNATSLSLIAPAKINWFLKIIGKRDDGYHNIRTLMQCINLYDNLIFEHTDDLEIVCDLNIQLIDNLVFKAASLLKKYTTYRKGARIILKKNIPVSAGLGGGSSDAAFTLSGLNKLWGINLNKKELNSIASEIGSDVPFFLEGPLALVEGKGEKVTPFKNTSSITLLLVKPPISVSTAWAYSCYDNKSELTKKPVDIKLFFQAFNNKDFDSLNTLLDNDLEKVVIEKYPVIKEIKNSMREMGAAIASMSGSGPTVFGVFDSMEAAKSASEGFKDCWIAVVQTILGI
jgi:4-diphosphocytidyl-2-C-methyl-D-erythritol kinase